MDRNLEESAVESHYFSPFNFIKTWSVSPSDIMNMNMQYTVTFTSINITNLVPVNKILTQLVGPRQH